MFGRPEEMKILAQRVAIAETGVSSQLFRRLRLRRLQQRAFASAFVTVEPLEELQLLSASSPLNAVAAPLLTIVPSAASGQPSPSVTNGSPIGHTPAQIAQAYGFNQVAFDNGAIKGNGAGQTIAIVDAYYDPNIASDLQKFDAQFGLTAPPSFSQFVAQGATTNSGWALETALDVEWAHAMAPGANIDLIEANNNSLGSLLSAVNYARNLSNVSVVSMSWGGSEFAAETQYDSLFTTPAGHIGITFVASSGDAGAGTTWPSVSPNVLAVGGTSLSASSTGSYLGETAWSGSGGGVSSFESAPSYQTSIRTSGRRTTPDVSYNADPNSGFAVYDSIPYAGQNGWFEVGGTSAGAPQWAALIAIADQGRALHSQGTLSNAQSTLYALPSSDFHDITAGSNGFAATAGYDPVTGRGSPVVNSIVQALSGGTTSSPQTTAAATTVTPTTTSTRTTHSNPGTPSSPSSPTTTVGSRAELSAALVMQPEVAVAAINGGFQLEQVQSTPIAYVPQISDRLAPLTSPVGSTELLTPLDSMPGIASVSVPSLPTSSLNAGLGTSAVSSTKLPELTTGLSQFALAEVSADDAFVGPLSTLSGEEMARAVGSLSPGFVENGLGDAVSHSAIDALFATNGWLAQAAPSVETPPSSSDLGKAALTGVAGSIGLFGLIAAIRRRRNAAAQ
jgi:hypothetical protein